MWYIAKLNVISTHSSSVHARICVAIFLVRLPGRTSFLSLFCAASAAYTLRVCVLLLFYCNWSCPWMSIKYHFITALQCIIIVYTGTSSMSLLRKRFNEMKWIFLCFYSRNAKSNNWRRRLDRCAFADLEKNAATTHTTLHSMLELRIKLNSLPSRKLCSIEISIGLFVFCLFQDYRRYFEHASSVQL